jgi:hypothetical protein
VQRIQPIASKRRNPVRRVMVLASVPRFMDHARDKERAIEGGYG